MLTRIKSQTITDWWDEMIQSINYDKFLSHKARALTSPLRPGQTCYVCLNARIAKPKSHSLQFFSFPEWWWWVDKKHEFNKKPWSPGAQIKKILVYYCTMTTAAFELCIEQCSFWRLQEVNALIKSVRSFITSSRIASWTLHCIVNIVVVFFEIFFTRKIKIFSEC